MSGNGVLVVDDEPGVVALCDRVLNKAGYQVAVAESAEAGLSLLRSRPFDLLLADIRMPSMDGFEMMRRARDLQPELAIVIMTGFGTVETAIRALEEGANGLVLKPFESNLAMLRQVERAIEDTRARREGARSRALQPLFDLTETLFGETEEASLAARVTGAVRAQMDCRMVGFYLVDTSSRTPRLLSRLGEAPQTPDDVAAGPLRRALSRLEVVRLTSGDASIADEERAWMEARGVGTLLCVPARRGQGTYLIAAGREAGRAPFSDGEAELLVLLTRQAAVAHENARLYGALRAYVQEIERSQQRLVQTEKLAAIGRLTASIAHEVNNPLQSLRNCLDLASRDGVEAARRQEYLQLARKELDRLSWIMRQMLEFYRPEAAARQLVDLGPIVREVSMLTAAQCQSVGIEVSLELAQDLPPVRGVKFQLQQVALNLVLNALEAMPEGGRLLLQTAAERNRVAMVVRDTGLGIARQELPRIFEPFYTSKQGGTGLGLAVSYGIVSAHGGTIEVESDPGAGSTFKVLLPVAEEE